MKVVLFCGGLGMRLREYSEKIPKPMVPIGSRPILWHIMKYYAHYGHRDFVICLGYKGDVIKDYFLNYNECHSNNFVLSEGARRIDLLRKDIEDWRITFVDTGLTSNVGERLAMIEPFLEGEEMFLANYSDGLTDCHLPDVIADFERRDSIGTFLSVKPNYSFHVVSHGQGGTVLDIQDVAATDIRINGGYFVFRKEIFDYMEPGEELVLAPFQRLIQQQRLSAYLYEGFWRGVDTFKDLQNLDTSYSQGNAPWELWRAEESVPDVTLLQTRRERRGERLAGGGSTSQGGTSANAG